MSRDNETNRKRKESAFMSVTAVRILPARWMWQQVAEWAAEKLKHQGVVIAREYKFMCSSLGQELIEKDIKELGFDPCCGRGMFAASA